MPVIFKNAKIKVAANSSVFSDPTVKEAWRCFVGDDKTPHLMVKYTFHASEANLGGSSEFTTEEGLDPRMWLEYQGDIEIDDDGIGLITLKPHPSN